MRPIPAPPPIETERLRIRRFRESDLEPFTTFMTDAGATRDLAFPEELKTVDGAAQILRGAIDAYDTAEPQCAVAVEERATGEWVGACGLSPLEGTTGAREAETFWTVARAHWGRGFATEMAQALVDWALEERAADRLVAFIVVGHQASIAVARKAGFRDLGIEERDGYRGSVHRFVRDA